MSSKRPAAEEVRVVRVTGLSNREFLEKHAAPGRVGLAGGASWIDRAIRKSERRLRADRSPSPWSHALLFQGARVDGRHWVVEADVDVAHAQFRNGVQENRIDKYFKDEEYPHLAVLDFGLDQGTVERILTKALDLAAARVRYSYGGIVATWLALHKGTLDRKSPLQVSHRTFCSSFLQMLYLEAGVRFAAGVELAHVTPEHIAQCRVPHTRWLLDRGA